MRQGLEKVSNTITYRQVILTLRELYGFEDDELNDDNWQEISSRIRHESRSYPDWAIRILDKMNVFKVILDLGTHASILT